MKQRTQFARAAVAAVAASVALSACSSGGGSSNPYVPPKTVGSALRIVGMGDSLTAGVQSNGLMGEDTTNPIPGSPFATVQATQEHGFWALLWQQANPGVDISDPSVSPLPLIAAPGIGTVLTLNGQGSPTPITTACGGLNQIAYNFSKALGVRLAPKNAPFDIGVPGQTMHEAVYQYQPTGPCNTLPGPIGALGALLSENNYFYPVLGNYGVGHTQLQAAVALRPHITTVWLGSNDLLKYAFSGGAVGPTSPAQFSSDLATIIRTLQTAGSKVAVSNLVDVLNAAFFFPGPEVEAVITGNFLKLGLPLPVAEAFAAELAAEIEKESGVGPNGGWLTLQGLGKTFAAFQNGQSTIGLVPQGDYVTAALGASLQKSNDALNSAIASTVAANGATLVDIHAQFAQIVANGGIYPLNSKCCSLQYEGGFFSWDGIHPSNTGYAVLANTFIGTLDKAYGLSIPQVDVGAIYATDPYAPH
jgi:lysophospholipase L1-like esterase